jgi:hypothetical protein
MMIRFLSLAAVLLLLSTNDGAQALSLKNKHSRSAHTAAMNRRQALGKTVATAFGFATLQQPALAANAGPTPDELKRIQVGYKQITDLLDNFEEATTTCRENGGECKRDAEPIREYHDNQQPQRHVVQLAKVTTLAEYAHRSLSFFL